MIQIPDHISYEEAALVEPLNCSLKAVRKAHVKREDSVLILAQGSIGLALTQLCVRERPRNIFVTDLVDFKLTLAKQYGAHHTFYSNDPQLKEKLLSANRGIPPNKCFIAVEHVEAIEQALLTVAGGGKIVFAFDKMKEHELLIDPHLISNKEIDIIGSYSSDFAVHDESAQLVFSHTIDMRDMVTHRYPLENLPDAINMAYKAAESIKIMIHVADD